MHPSPATPPHTTRPWPLPAAASPRIEAMRAELTAIDDPSARESRADELARRLLAEGTPIVEDAGDGQARFTFLWHGDAPHGVALLANKLSDPLDPADTLLRPVAGTRLHALTVRMPDAWLATYLYWLPGSPLPPAQQRGPVSQETMLRMRAELRADPHAREHAPNKLAPAPFAVARGPHAPRPRLHDRPAAELLALAPVTSPASGAPLALHRWSHPQADATSPALLFADGEVWREQYPIVPELAARISAGELPPAHALLLDSGGPEQRPLDYAGDAATTRALIEQVRAHLPVGAPLVVVGQSFGGLLAAMATTRHPDLVAAGIAQSPSLWWPNSGSFQECTGAWFAERASAPEAAPLLLQAGTTEWDLERDVRHAAALLEAQGTLIRLDLTVGGHDAIWWQALLADAIAATLARLHRRAAP